MTKQKLDKLKLAISIMSIALVILLLALPKCTEDKAKQNLKRINKNMQVQIGSK